MKIDFSYKDRYFIWDTKQHQVEIYKPQQKVEIIEVAKNANYFDVEKLVFSYKPPFNRGAKYEYYI